MGDGHRAHKQRQDAAEPKHVARQVRQVGGHANQGHLLWQQSERLWLDGCRMMAATAATDTLHLADRVRLQPSPPAQHHCLRAWDTWWKWKLRRQ